MRLGMAKFRRLFVSLLLISSAPGCANSVAQPVRQEPQRVSKASPVRVIVTFNHLPAANDQRLLPLLAEACNCTPVFFRQYLDNALIYEIVLPSDMTFSVFRNILLDRTAALGVRGVEQDILMHPQ
jgi:hypothetical protein